MVVVLYDAQGNKTTDPAKAVRSVTDNPGSDSDVSTSLPGEGELFRIDNDTIGYRVGGVVYGIGSGSKDGKDEKARVLSQLGIEEGDLPNYSTDIYAVGGLTQSAIDFTKDPNESNPAYLQA